MDYRDLVGQTLYCPHIGLGENTRTVLCVYVCMNINAICIRTQVYKCGKPYIRRMHLGKLSGVVDIGITFAASHYLIQGFLKGNNFYFTFRS